MNNDAEYNKKLIDTYPFLMPYNRWTGNTDEFFDYSYTELDAMPDGWRKAFGEQMMQEIKDELVRAEAERTDTPEERRRIVDWYRVDAPEGTPDDYLHIWKFTQIKEKYGTLRVYPNFIFGDVDKIINKYEKISERICIECGEPATKISLGWISPWCDECASKNTYERYKPIDEYYGAFEEDGDCK